MTKEEQIEELASVMCKHQEMSGCKDCPHTCRAIVYAERIIELGYEKKQETVKNFGTSLICNSVFTYENVNGAGLQCENLISQFEETVKDLALSYGVKIDE